MNISIDELNQIALNIIKDELLWGYEASDSFCYSVNGIIDLLDETKNYLDKKENTRIEEGEK